jgi:uncharacterized repeat protein (TIGR03803 family)
MKVSGRIDLFHGAVAVVGVSFALTVSSWGQTFATAASFNGTDGNGPLYGALAQGTNGSYYGTTMIGGANNNGVVFELTPSGELVDLYSFCSQVGCADGAVPYFSPVLGSDGNLYGTTFNGGNTLNEGTIYTITSDGKFSTLYSFCPAEGCLDGGGPTGLVAGGDGNLYGTTAGGGAWDRGTLFQISPSGQYKVLYNFCSSYDCGDGSDPFSAPLVGADGNFYGTTYFGGRQGKGVVYRVTGSGEYTVLYDFCSRPNCADGSTPFSPPVQDASGNLYGTTFYGGGSNYGVVYEITSSGQFIVLHSFGGVAISPSAALVLATDGNLYGTTVGGYGKGAEIFEVTPAGEFSQLYTFCETCSGSGIEPYGTLLQSTDGTFYGMTNGGGAFGYGIVFSYSLNFGPMVKTVPTVGKVGSRIIILGNNLTGSSSVTFNGVAAAFTVESDTYISATVPAGATTGIVSVVTPTGTLNSNPQFVVTK